jgi:hypothetical protein
MYHDVIVGYIIHWSDEGYQMQPVFEYTLGAFETRLEALWAIHQIENHCVKITTPIESKKVDKIGHKFLSPEEQKKIFEKNRQKNNASAKRNPWRNPN